MVFFKNTLPLVALSILVVGCVFQGEQKGSFSINKEVKEVPALFSWNIDVSDNASEHKGEAQLKLFDKENQEKTILEHSFKLDSENAEYFTYADDNNERHFKVVRSIKPIVSDKDGKFMLEGTVEQVEQKQRDGRVGIQTNIMIDAYKDGELYGSFVAVGISYKKSE